MTHCDVLCQLHLVEDILNLDNTASNVWDDCKVKVGKGLELHPVPTITVHPALSR